MLECFNRATENNAKTENQRKNIINFIKKEGMYLNPSKKQFWHIEPPYGLLNDPNGLIWYGGEYHIFFQWNRLAKDHSNKSWGHCTSPDLVHWQFQGSAMLPDKPYDAQGVYSGSAVESEGQLCLYYTGNVKQEGRRIASQCLALSRDGLHFDKQGPVLATPPGFTSHFRDPKVVPAPDGGWWMLLGAQCTEGLGTVVRFWSADGRSWDSCHLVGRSQEYQMIECPDLFPLDGALALLYCPQHRDNVADTSLDSIAVYKLAFPDLGDIDLQLKDLDKEWYRMDEGFDFYAPQTFQTPDGRRILLGWMSRMEGEEETAFAADEPRIHCLTMPREVFRRGARLCQRPVRELAGQLGDGVDAQLEGNTQIYHPGSRAFCFRWESAAPCGDLELVLHDGEWSFQYCAASQHAELRRRRWTDKGEDLRQIPLAGLTSLELWCDQSSAELFLNGGELVLSARICPAAAQPSLRVSGLPKDAPAQLRLLPVTIKNDLTNEEELS